MISLTFRATVSQRAAHCAAMETSVHSYSVLPISRSGLAPVKFRMSKEFTAEEVKQHVEKKDLYMVIHGKGNDSGLISKSSAVAHT